MAQEPRITKCLLSGVLLCVLVTVPVDYAANQSMYKAVFEHALYAFEPLE